MDGWQNAGPSLAVCQRDVALNQVFLHAHCYFFWPEHTGGFDQSIILTLYLAILFGDFEKVFIPGAFSQLQFYLLIAAWVSLLNQSKLCVKLQFEHLKRLSANIYLCCWDVVLSWRRFKLPFQILSSSLHWASLLSLSFKGRESESWHRNKTDVYICQNITCFIEVGPSCQTLNQKIPRSSAQVDITMEYTQCKGTWKKLKSHCCVSVLPGLTWDECDVLNLISSYLSLHWDN